MPTRPLSLSLHTRIALGVLLLVLAALGLAGYFQRLDILALCCVVAGAGTWYWLRQALAPLRAAAEMLDAMSQGKLPRQALPVERDDEIGRLLGAINGLLASPAAGEITQHKEAEGELRIAAATFESQQGMFITDAAHRIIRINHAFTELTGYGPEEALGQTPDLLRPSGTDELLYLDMIRQLEASGVWQGELWNQRRDGKPIAVWKTVSAVRDTQGKVTHYVAAFSDITERQRAEEKLRHNKDLMQAILNAIQESIFLIDPQDIVIAVNPTAARRMGMEVKDMVGKDLFSLFPADVAETRRELTHQVARSGQPRVTEDVRNNLTFFNSFYPLFDESGKVEAVVVVATDITERKRLEQDLEQQARTDPLTGLLNRRHFMALAEAELARATRYRAPLSVLMLDIDHFKRINDTRGHRTGDLVLQHLARLAKQTLRDVDIVGRLGGEEFAILLPQTEGEKAMEVAERLRQAIAGSAVMPDAGLPLHYTASLGVAGVTEGGLTNVDTLLNEADLAMYAAKKAGRNRTHRSQPT